MAYPTGAKVLKLNCSFEIDGRKVEQLVVRRPKVRDNLIASKKETDEDREMTMMSLLTGEEDAVLQEMDMLDYDALQKVVVGFRKTDSLTSETSKEE
jgi:hypothetical protein